MSRIKLWWTRHADIFVASVLIFMMGVMIVTAYALVRERQKSEFWYQMYMKEAQIVRQYMIDKP